MSDLLTTKLFVPRHWPDSVERTRLTDQLKKGMDRELTLITAPAGFGKTTLLSEWIPQSECGVAWVSLDKGDNDPTRFWAYFIAALQTLSADIGNEALALLQSPQPPPIEAILTLLLNDVTGFPDSFAQVLDDYQVIHSRSIHNAILFFLEHMPPHMHLVIASRTDPPFPLGHLRARKKLREIRAVDLRFTLEETAVFLNQTMGLSLSAESVVPLDEYIEGWIAGLHLAELALQGQDPQPDTSRVSEFIHAFGSNHPYIDSYLGEEVLSQLPKGTVDFLLQTSILDSLSAPLCDYILGRSSIPHSQAILERLERANLFIIPLDGEGKWFRYHYLFAEVLRARLRKSRPGKLRELHLRACAWYEAAGSIPEAVRHGLEAGEWECAAQLMEQNGLPFGSKGQIQLILSWLTGLPESVMRSHPLLCIIHAGALMRTNRLEDAAARLRDAEDGIRVDTPGDTPADQARLILGRVSMVRSSLLRIQGDLRGCVEHARQAVESLPESDAVTRANAAVNLAHGFLISGDVNLAGEDLVTSALQSARASGNVEMAVRGTTLLARLRALQGRLHRSEEIYAEAASGQDEGSPFTGISDYFFGLGDLKREWNELDEAERILAQGVVQARSCFSDGDALMHGYQALARLKQARGDTQGAKATLDEFTQLAQQYHLSDELLHGVRAVQAWLDLMADNDCAAARWAETRGIYVGDEFSFPQEREYLTLARLLIRRGRDRPENEAARKALYLLDRLAAAAQADGRMRSLIEIVGLQALAFQAMGDRGEALKSIEQALTLAGPEGYMRIFLDEGEPMRLLIADVRASLAARSPVARWPNERQPDGCISPLSYADRLLAAFPRATPTALPVSRRDGEVRTKPAFADLLESLSDRELTVLQLIADGASNAEIAATLIISVSTVKRHTGNLYGKLGVSRRTQAIARAQQLRLLP